MRVRGLSPPQLLLAILAAAAIAIAAVAAFGSSVDPGSSTEAGADGEPDSGSADLAGTIAVGFVADQFGGDDLIGGEPEARATWWRRLVGTNAELVRINLYWNQVAVGQAEPTDPTDPANPAYDWTIPDEAAREAVAHGLIPVFTVVGAPRWAEGADHPPESEYRVGTWKPDEEMFGRFAEAAARRYSGEFEGLPRVRYWEAWNEPNLPRYLAPQWDGKRPAAAESYRALLNSFYEAVHSVDDGNVVVAGGTSPFGDPPGGERIRPYRFWREVLCLRNRTQLEPKKDCPRGEGRAHMDVYAHNPINALGSKGPTTPPPHADDGVPANFDELGRIVRAAERQETILPPMSDRPGWATETWYESNPPDVQAVNLRTQGLYMEQVLQVLSDQGATAVFFLQLRDSPYDPDVPALAGFQTGVYFVDGEPKPSLRAVRFPFVAERVSETEVRIWGKAPRSGRLEITGGGDGGSDSVATLDVEAGEAFERTIELPQAAEEQSLTARIGASRSLRWPLE